jgi:acetylglutamate kinase
MMIDSTKGIAGLKGALRYVRAYRDHVFVVKLGGDVLADVEALDHVAGQLGLLQSLGIRIVVVHGGGPQASALLRRHQVQGVGVSGVDADLITAHRRPPMNVTGDDGVTRMVDYGHVGDIESVDPRLLLTLVESRFVPVISSLAGDGEGNVYNVNADTVAETLAIALKAQKLIFLTGAPGVLRDRNDPSSLVTFADPDDLEALLASGVIAGGMRPKVEACIRAATGGVERTHIIDGRVHDSLLLEVFTGSGAGTMIVGRKEKATYLGVDLANGDPAA